jgi:hypothetical protein
VIEILTTPLGPVSLVAVIYATIIYLGLSRKLGAVTKMRPYYRLFLVSLGFLCVALTAYVVRNAAYLNGEAYAEWLLSPTFGLVFFHLPLFIGVSLNGGLIWRYWSWLLTEKQE